jgi:hypothetical protein
MEEKDQYSIYHNALKLAEKGEFQESLNLMNEVFIFHPEGAIAYKHYFRGLVESNMETRMRNFERAKESFKFLLTSVDGKKEETGMVDIHKTMIDHWEGLEGARQSTIEEYDQRRDYGDIVQIMKSVDVEE